METRPAEPFLRLLRRRGRAGSAFRQVSATDEADQRHLVEGFGHLRRVFLLQSILVIVVLALMVLAVGVMTLILLTKGSGGQ